MKSILNKSYHRRRALWSSFVTCGCGCVFNFLSIKSKYTPFIFSPTVKSKQGESTWADRWGIFIYICQTVFPFFFHRWSWWCDSTGKTVPACLPSIKHTHEFVNWRGGGGEKKSSPPACLVRSWMGKTNKHQTSAAQRKLYFIIKWLLIRVSCSCGCFDQRQNCHRDASLSVLIVDLFLTVGVARWQRYCLLTATAVN